jgi:hypothetical protein
MKYIKTFETSSELKRAKDVLDEAGVSYEFDNNTLVLRVHVRNFIRARDVLIDWQNGLGST